jgi:hypothetical protein
VFGHTPSNPARSAAMAYWRALLRVAVAGAGELAGQQEHVHRQGASVGRPPPRR